MVALLFLAAPLWGASRPIPIILETDIGGDVDDTYALVLAARSPQVNLLAVVTAYGNVALRSAVSRKLLLLMGKDQVPVARKCRWTGSNHFEPTGKESASLRRERRYPESHRCRRRNSWPKWWRPPKKKWSLFRWVV